MLVQKVQTASKTGAHQARTRDENMPFQANPKILMVTLISFCSYAMWLCSYYSLWYLKFSKCQNIPYTSLFNNVFLLFWFCKNVWQIKRCLSSKECNQNDENVFSSLYAPYFLLANCPLNYLYIHWVVYITNLF